MKPTASGQRKPSHIDETREDSFLLSRFATHSRRSSRPEINYHSKSPRKPFTPTPAVSFAQRSRSRQEQFYCISKPAPGKHVTRWTEKCPPGDGTEEDSRALEKVRVPRDINLRRRRKDGSNMIVPTRVANDDGGEEKKIPPRRYKWKKPYREGQWFFQRSLSKLWKLYDISCVIGDLNRAVTISETGRWKLSVLSYEIEILVKRSLVTR